MAEPWGWYVGDDGNPVEIEWPNLGVNMPAGAAVAVPARPKSPLGDYMNAPCGCGSGKDFKKCCLKNLRNSLPYRAGKVG